MPKREVLEVKDGIQYKLCIVCNKLKTYNDNFYTKNVQRQCKACTKDRNTKRNKERRYYKPVTVDMRRKENKPAKDEPHGPNI